MSEQRKPRLKWRRTGIGTYVACGPMGEAIYVQRCDGGWHGSWDCGTVTATYRTMRLAQIGTEEWAAGKCREFLKRLEVEG